jgi:hypothetical protein
MIIDIYMVRSVYCNYRVRDSTNFENFPFVSAKLTSVTKEGLAT